MESDLDETKELLFFILPPMASACCGSERLLGVSQSVRPLQHNSVESPCPGCYSAVKGMSI